MARTTMCRSERHGKIRPQNPYAVVVMALAILVIGVTAIRHIPTDILPQLKTPAVDGGMTDYPGFAHGG